MAATKSRPAKRERLEARISAEQKELLQQAADLRGLSVTDFVISNAIQAARRVLEEDHTIFLSEQESLAFADALLNPQPANDRLRRAAQRYKELMGQPTDNTSL